MYKPKYYCVYWRSKCIKKLGKIGDLATRAKLTSYVFGCRRVQQCAQVSLNQAHHFHTHRLNIHILVLTSMSSSGDYGANAAALKSRRFRPTRWAPSQSSRVTSCSRTTFTFPLNQFWVWNSQECRSLLSSPNSAKPTAGVTIVRTVRLGSIPPYWSFSSPPYI